MMNLSAQWREALSGLPEGSTIFVSGPHSHGYTGTIQTPTHLQHDRCRDDGEPCLLDTWRVWYNASPESALEAVLSAWLDATRRVPESEERHLQDRTVRDVTRHPPLPPRGGR